MRKLIHTFRVTGARGFPLDMLRYDCAWPATSDDAVTVSDLITGSIPHGHSTQVLFRSINPPTSGRWASFGWTVSDHTSEKVEFTS